MLALVVGLVLAADPIARSEAPAGAITAQAGAAAPRLLGVRPAIPPDELLTVLPGTSLKTTNGAVSLTCRADPTGASPVPVLETAFVLSSAPDADLAVTLDRGRIDLMNLKTDGPARVLVTLDSPGSRVAVELAGRRPPGTRFEPMTRPVAPVLSAVVVALSGSGSVADGRVTIAVSAPPGPAQLSWTSVGGPDRQAVRLDRLPAWASPAAENTPEAKAVKAAVDRLRSLRAANADTATDVLLSSKVPAEWRVGLVTAAAADDLPRLAKVLSESADPAVWDFGVVVLRHWLGRSAGQDGRLARFLTDVRMYDPVAAATVIDLLAGFTATERSRAESYDVLVEYLQHDKPAVRNLAQWHLVRMVPAGKAIAFRPNAGKAESAAAYKEWRKLVPPGTVPAGRAKDAVGKP